MALKIEAATRLQTGDDEQVLNLTITCKGDAGKTLINLLQAIEYNTGVGHSCTIGAFFDGDGADKISIEGLPEGLGKDMAAACGSYGDDLLASIGADTATAYNTRYNTDGEQVVIKTPVWPPEA